MGYKKERRLRLRERRELDRIRELSVTLAEITNAYRSLQVDEPRHVSVGGLSQAINVVANALNEAVRGLEVVQKKAKAAK